MPLSRRYIIANTGTSILICTLTLPILPSLAFAYDRFVYAEIKLPEQANREGPRVQRRLELHCWAGMSSAKPQGRDSSLQAPCAPAACGDDEDLSDLDDSEAGMYLHTEEEAKLKEVIWTELNRDFLDKQQVKAAAAAEHARKVRSTSQVLGGVITCGDERATAAPLKIARWAQAST